MSMLATRLEAELGSDGPFALALPAHVEALPTHKVASRRFVAHCHSGIAGIARVWADLQQEGLCTAYQRLEWVQCLIEHLATSARRAIVVVEVRDQMSQHVIMLLPFVVLRRGLCVKIEWCDLGVCDYAAPVIAAGANVSPAEMAAIWVVVKAALPKADLIRINRIPAMVAGHVNPMAGLPGVRRSTMHASGVVLEGPPETLMKRLGSPSILRELNKARNRLTQAGPLRFVVAETAAEMTEIFEAIVAQRRERFAQLGRFDLLALPEVENFYRDAARRNLESGFVRLFGVKVGGDWVAAAYGLVHGGAFHGILLAMAGGAWQRCSPGLFIAAEIMVWARREKLRYFDFTIGAMPYKVSLGAQSRDLFDLSETLTWRGKVVEAAIYRAASAKAALTRYPAVFKRLRSFRRVIRRSLRV